MSETDVSRRRFLTTAAATGTGLSFLSETQAAGAKKKTLLFVGAHMDDSEWGAGGVMFKALNVGHRVVVNEAVSDWSN